MGDDRKVLTSVLQFLMLPSSSLTCYLQHPLVPFSITYKLNVLIVDFLHVIISIRPCPYLEQTN